MHVKLQTWFPLQIQVYVNGHEWLARKLQQHQIRYTKRENGRKIHPNFQGKS